MFCLYNNTMNLSKMQEDSLYIDLPKQQKRLLHCFSAEAF